MSVLGAYKLTIKEHHLDTFGHVNNAVYLTLYEEARWELITQRGYSLKVVQEKAQGPVILDLQLKFLKELHLREEITIQTEFIDYTGKIGHLKQTMINSRGEACSEITMTYGLFDLKARKLITPTPEWQKVIGVSN